MPSIPSSDGDKQRYASPASLAATASPATINHVDNHHYPPPNSPAAMMIIMTMHRLHVRPGLTGRLKCV